MQDFIHKMTPATDTQWPEAKDVCLLIQVEGLPGYVLEPVSRGVRGAERRHSQNASRDNGPEGSVKTVAHEVD